MKSESQLQLCILNLERERLSVVRRKAGSMQPSWGYTIDMGIGILGVNHAAYVQFMLI